MTEEFKDTIEIVDDEGTVIKCELYDIIDFEDKQYAMLLEKDTEEENPEVVLMRYIEEGEECFFETIDNDEEFEKVSKYIDTIDEDDKDEE